MDTRNAQPPYQGSRTVGPIGGMRSARSGRTHRRQGSRPCSSSTPCQPTKRALILLTVNAGRVDAGRVEVARLGARTDEVDEAACSPTRLERVRPVPIGVSSMTRALVRNRLARVEFADAGKCSSVQRTFFGRGAADGADERRFEPNNATDSDHRKSPISGLARTEGVARATQRALDTGSTMTKARWFNSPMCDCPDHAAARPPIRYDVRRPGPRCRTPPNGSDPLGPDVRRAKPAYS